MEPKFEILAVKRLVGWRIRMSLSDNRTVALWRDFMPRRKEIKNTAGTELYSVEVYDPLYFEYFDPNATFDKWAAVEVTDFEVVPGGMETMTLSGGLYAVFLHKGTASAGQKTFQYIFNIWLPGSGYKLDDRPHLAVMGDKYKNEDLASEEEIWIPVKPMEN